MNTCCRGDISFRTTLSGTSDSARKTKPIIYSELKYVSPKLFIEHMMQSRNKHNFTILKDTICENLNRIRNPPSRRFLPSGEGVQSNRFPDKLNSTASPTDERRLCNADSPPRSLRFRSRCSCAGVPPGAPELGPLTASSVLHVAAPATDPPTDDRRDNSSRY